MKARDKTRIHEGKRQDQDTLMKANNRKADITPNDYCTTSIMD